MVTPVKGESASYPEGRLLRRLFQAGVLGKQTVRQREQARLQEAIHSLNSNARKRESRRQGWAEGEVSGHAVPKGSGSQPQRALWSRESAGALFSVGPKGQGREAPP